MLLFYLPMIIFEGLLAVQKRDDHDDDADRRRVRVHASSPRR
jgi:hypothetical protein